MSGAVRIAPSEEGQEVNPPCAGSWQRNPDGSLVPADAATERAAAAFLGLDTQSQAADPAPVDPME